MTYSPKDTPPPVETLTEEEIEDFRANAHERLAFMPERTDEVCDLAIEAVAARELAAKCLEAMEPENDEAVLEQIAYPMRERLKGYDTSVRAAPASSPEREPSPLQTATLNIESALSFDPSVPVQNYLRSALAKLKLLQSPSPTQPCLSQDDEELVKAIDAILDYVQSLSARAQQAEAEAKENYERFNKWHTISADQHAELSSCRSECEGLKEAMKDRTGTAAFMLELKWRDNKIAALEQLNAQLAALQPKGEGK